jgi:hypothetical protein
MWPALRALKAMGGSATNEELSAKIVELKKYPRRFKPSNIPTIGRRNSIINPHSPDEGTNGSGFAAVLR